MKPTGSGHRSRRWRKPVGKVWLERWLVLVAGFIAAVPVLVATGRAIAVGWMPGFDDATIATRAYDVLSLTPPLVGQYSDASLPDGPPVYTAGPLLFWLLAIPTHLPWDWALPLAMGFANAVMVLGIVWLAHRRAGRPLMIATAIAVALMCRSLPDEALYAPLNPFSGEVAVGLMVFLAWSVACGDHLMLPLLVGVTSFVAQVHFSLVLPALAGTVIAAVGLGIGLRRVRHAGGGEWSRARRSLVAAVVVGFVCWSAPLLDQALNDPGNLGEILRATTVDEKRYGTRGGWHAAVNAVGAWPWWAGQPEWSGVAGITEVASPPSPKATASAVILVAVLVAMGAAGVRRRRADVVAGSVLALVLGAAIVVAASSTPTRLFFGLAKALTWASPAGMFVWLVALWASIAVLGPAAARFLDGPLHRWSRPSRAAWTASGVALTSVVAVIASSDGGTHRSDWTFAPIRELSSELDGRLPRSETVLVRARLPEPLDAFRFNSALVYQLRRSGHRVVTTDLFLLDDKLGPSYAARRHPPSRTLDLTQGAEPPRRAGSRVLARVRVPQSESGTPAGVVVATITPSGEE